MSHEYRIKFPSGSIGDLLQQERQSSPVMEKAVELRKRNIKARNARQDRVDLADDVRVPQDGPEIIAYPALKLIDAIGNGRLALKEKRSMDAVKGHYNAHRAEYQDNAVKDAQRQGVEINFSGDEAADVKPEKSITDKLRVK